MQMRRRGGRGLGFWKFRRRLERNGGGEDAGATGRAIGDGLPISLGSERRPCAVPGTLRVVPCVNLILGA